MGIAHHLGWAVAVTASAGHEVVDRRRIELIEPGLPAAPVEHEARYLGDDAAVRIGMTPNGGLFIRDADVPAAERRS